MSGPTVRPTGTDTSSEATRLLDAAFLRGWLREMAREIGERRDFLTQLDAAIGDADHGINMDRGMRAALAECDTGSLREAAPGPLLEGAGRAIVYTVGGAAGPLYGTAFRRIGAALGGGSSFDVEELAAALAAGLDGIQQLGAAVEGDKTIVDAYAPALAAFDRELRNGGDVVSAGGAAADAAAEGMRATVPLQARKGRASYLGVRSVGHQDPGATSTAIMFAALARAADETYT